MKTPAAVTALLLALAACGSNETPPGSSDARVEDTGAGADVLTQDAEAADAGDGRADAGGEDVAPDSGCELGSRCNPIRVTTYPFTDTRDTRAAPSDAIDRYDCAPDTDESGGELFYELELGERVRLVASIDDAPGDQVDVDVHLLRNLDPASCFARDNVTVTALLDPGTYYLVADTWVTSNGDALAGPYRLDISAEPIATGSCAVDAIDLAMFWTSCASGIDCYEGQDPADGATVRFLRTPATGPVVKEAHLVTVDETFPNDWPTSFTDQIDRHYQISQAATGYVMNRGEPWAPAGEGGSHYGQGARGVPLPVVDEGWYINMYWRHRPAPGVRMIVRNPDNGRAAVASAGYETGPGSNTAIAGVTEEIHDYLGTAHRDVLEVGFAVDQALPLGPITCP